MAPKVNTRRVLSKFKEAIPWLQEAIPTKENKSVPQNGIG